MNVNGSRLRPFLRSHVHKHKTCVHGTKMSTAYVFVPNDPYTMGNLEERTRQNEPETHGEQHCQPSPLSLLVNKEFRIKIREESGMLSGRHKSSRGRTELFSSALGYFIAVHFLPTQVGQQCFDCRTNFWCGLHCLFGHLMVLQRATPLMQLQYAQRPLRKCAPLLYSFPLCLQLPGFPARQEISSKGCL